MNRVTTECHAWIITKTNGAALGFCDHDRALSVNGVLCQPQAGLASVALQQSSGMSIDNTEASGYLSDVAINESDIKLGLYDGAEVQTWRVDWQNTETASLEFRGHISSITQKDTLFHAEIQGLTAALNRPVGRVFQKPCSAVLGDKRCGVDIGSSDVQLQVAVSDLTEGRVVKIPYAIPFDEGWFSHGVARVEYGNDYIKYYTIKNDRRLEASSEVEFWYPVIEPERVQSISLIAGCDKRFETCKSKFNNAINFQGFPDIPDQDWMAIHPTQSSEKSGGTRR